MKQIGLVVKNDRKVMVRAAEFERWLEKEGVRVVRRENPKPNAPRDREPRLEEDLFCVFVLGGDGTFLSAVRWIGDRDIPVVGVKFGEVGFLAEILEERLFDVAGSILKSDFTHHERMRLTAAVLAEDGREVLRETVLNDVVVNKGALARLASIQTDIDGQYLTTYRADGLIVATPTGSTAYSLAAGGPVIHPAVAGFIMTPICPFTLTNRPLIVPDDAAVGIRVEEKATDIRVTFDGQSGCRLEAGQRLVIRKSAHSVRMIAVPGQNYYDVLKTKLHWSGGRA